MQEKIQLLVTVKLMCQIELAWARGHSRVTWNEVVDGMAKENAVAVQLAYPALPWTEREIRKEIKNKIKLLSANGNNGGKQFLNVEPIKPSLMYPPHSTERWKVDGHKGAHHSYAGSNRPWPFCWPPFKVEGVNPVNLQTLWGDGGDVAPSLGRVPGTRTGVNS